jgi:hypothetical protein
MAARRQTENRSSSFLGYWRRPGVAIFVNAASFCGAVTKEQLPPFILSAVSRVNDLLCMNVA